MTKKPGLLLLLMWVISLTSATQAEESIAPILGKITIVRQNIFSQQTAQTYLASHYLNRLHTVTREKVIRREIWMQPGDTVTTEDLLELERNLRALDLFAEVRVTLVPTPIATATAAVQNKNGSQSAPAATGAVVSQAPVADLIVETRDQLSLRFSAGGSLLGGIGEVKFSVGERNLFGLGHRLQFGYSTNTEGELLGSLAYDNVLLYGKDVYGGFQLGQTEEGGFAVLKLDNRFKNFNDLDAWAFRLSSESTRVDFFEQGRSTTEIPRDVNKLSFNYLGRTGRAGRFWRFGPQIELREVRYGLARGEDTSSIDIPADSTSVFLGASVGRTNISEYRKVSWLDTLTFTQDLSLGYSLETTVGIQFSRQKPASDSVAQTAVADSDNDTSQRKPAVQLIASSKNEIFDNNYLNFAIDTFAFGRDGEAGLDAWSVQTGVTWFNTSLKHQTLAARLRYQAVRDRSGLPPQLTLGEGTGLRGYPAREFSGQQSLYLNLETRLRTPFELYRFRAGLVAFVDTGWVGERTQSLSGLLDTPYSSVGGGLRIGSRELLGRNILRVDFAVPLQDREDRDYQPSLSIALGQVFGFEP